MIKKNKKKSNLTKVLYVRVSDDAFKRFEKTRKSLGLKKSSFMDSILKSVSRHNYEKAVA